LGTNPSLQFMSPYCLDISCGDMLYHTTPTCPNSPPIAATSEKYILELHRMMRVRGSADLVWRVWREEFGMGESEELFKESRSVFNSSRPRLSNWTDCARLYCILACTGWQFSYKKKYFTGTYFPHKLYKHDLDKWEREARSRNIVYQESNIFNLNESLLGPNSFFYLHLPLRFDVYGCGYVWSKRKFNFILGAFEELAELGKTVVLSTPLTRLGVEVKGKREGLLSSKFTPQVVEIPKKSKYGLGEGMPPDSDIYYTANLP